jgi:hypothetical protein
MVDVLMASIQIDAALMTDVTTKLRGFHDTMEVYCKAVALLGENLASAEFTGIVGPAIVTQANQTVADLKKVMDLCGTTADNVNKAKSLIENTDNANAGLFR